MRKLRSHHTIALLLFSLQAASGADFSFFSILQAGQPNGGDFEIGVGASNGNVTGTSQYSFASTGIQTWRNNAAQTFRIGYNATTNQAYATVFNQAGGAITATYNGPVNSPVSNTATWTINPNELFVSAASRPTLTGIAVSGLTLQAGLTVLSPITGASMSIAQFGSNVSLDNSSPIVFRAASTGGSWFLTGQIRFQGLSGYTTNGASGNQLQLGLTASAVDTPEPTPFLLTGMGLVGLSLIRRRQVIARK